MSPTIHESETESAVVRFLKYLFLGGRQLKGWIQVWLLLLLGSMMGSLAFLPDPLAIAWVVGMALFVPINFTMVWRSRGIHKGIGLPHLPSMIAWLVFASVQLANEEIEFRGSAYDKAKYIWVVALMTTLSISTVFDAADTYMYWVARSHREVVRCPQAVQELQTRGLIAEPTDEFDFADLLRQDGEAASASRQQQTA